MPNAAGVVGEALSVASVNGNLAQLAWVTSINLEAIYAQTTDPFIDFAVWNNGGVLTFSAGSTGRSLDFSNTLNSMYLSILEDI